MIFKKLKREFKKLKKKIDSTEEEISKLRYNGNFFKKDVKKEEEINKLLEKKRNLDSIRMEAQASLSELERNENTESVNLNDVEDEDIEEVKGGVKYVKTEERCNKKIVYKNGRKKYVKVNKKYISLTDYKKKEEMKDKKKKEKKEKKEKK